MAEWNSIEEAEDALNKRYRGKLLQLEYIHPRKGLQTKAAIVDRLAIDTATKQTPHIIIFFNDGTRNEVDKDEFSTTTKLLN